MRTVDITKMLVLSVIIFVFMLPYSFASVLSVSRVDVDRVFDNAGKVWVVYFTSTGTDKIEARISPKDFENVAKRDVDPNAKVNQGFSMWVDSSDEKIVYYTYKSSDFTPIFELQPEKKQWYCGKSLTTHSCDNVKSEADEWVRKVCYKQTAECIKHAVWKGVYNDWYYTCYCFVQGDTLGYAQKITPPGVHFKTTVCVQIDGENKDCRTLTKDPSSAVLKSGEEDRKLKIEGMSTKFDDAVLIKWQGNLMTGDPIPRASDSRVIALKQVYPTKKWIIGSLDKYLEWKNYVVNAGPGSGIFACLAKWRDGQINDGTICTSQANSKAWNVFTPTDDMYFKNAGIYEEGDTARIVLEQPFKVQIPTFLAYIDADDLKIVIERGHPRINRIWAEPSVFNELEGGTVYVEIVNDGNGRGEFELYPGKSTYFAFSPSSYTDITLDPGESKILEFYVSPKIPENEHQISERVIFYLKERTTQQTVSRGFTLRSIEQKSCEPGKWYKTIKDGRECFHKCIDGYNYGKETCCAEDEYAELQPDGTYVCKKREEFVEPTQPGVPSIKPPSIPGVGENTTVWNIVIIAVAFFALLLLFLFLILMVMVIRR